MATLHTLRRVHGLTFSELSAVTQIPVRRLAAFEYQGADLDLQDRQRIAAFFGLQHFSLEAGIGGGTVYYAKRRILAAPLALRTATATLAVSLQTNATVHDTVIPPQLPDRPKFEIVAQETQPTPPLQPPTSTTAPSVMPRVVHAPNTSTPVFPQASDSSTTTHSPRVVMTALPIVTPPPISTTETVEASTALLATPQAIATMDHRAVPTATVVSAAPDQSIMTARITAYRQCRLSHYHLSH